MLSRFGTDSRASSTWASTCCCPGVCRNGGKYSSFDTTCAGIGSPNGSISEAGRHLAFSCGVISGWLCACRRFFMAPLETRACSVRPFGQSAIGRAVNSRRLLQRPAPVSVVRQHFQCVAADTTLRSCEQLHRSSLDVGEAQLASSIQRLPEQHP